MKENTEDEKNGDDATVMARERERERERERKRERASERERRTRARESRDREGMREWVCRAELGALQHIAVPSPRSAPLCTPSPSMH